MGHLQSMSPIFRNVCVKFKSSGNKKKVLVFKYTITIPTIMLFYKAKITFNLFITKKPPLYLGNFAIYIHNNILQVLCRRVAHEIQIFGLMYQQGKVGK